MKQFKSFGLVVVTLLFSVTMAFAAKPNIHILATGVPSLSVILR